MTEMTLLIGSEPSSANRQPT